MYVIYFITMTNSAELKELLWNGIPEGADAWIRADAWKIVLGYLPTNSERRSSTLQQKRRFYFDLVEEYYDRQIKTDEEQKLQKQILVDIPRMSPGPPMFTHPFIQKMLERALYVWAMRHPACGYVQGVNDLIVIFIVVFMEAETRQDAHDVDAAELTVECLKNVEADSFWCLSNLLSDLQDNYVSDQPGIQRQIVKLDQLIKRIDPLLHSHLMEQGLTMLQLTFRWMNCLLVRELPLRCSIRLWDTYAVEQATSTQSLADFHVFLCAVFLVHWSKQMRQMDFQQLMLFSQKFPTAKWRSQELETLVSEAFVLRSVFESTSGHLDEGNSSKALSAPI